MVRTLNPASISVRSRLLLALVLLLLVMVAAFSANTQSLRSTGRHQASSIDPVAPDLNLQTAPAAAEQTSSVTSAPALTEVTSPPPAPAGPSAGSIQPVQPVPFAAGTTAQPEATACTVTPPRGRMIPVCRIP